MSWVPTFGVPSSSGNGEGVRTVRSEDSLDVMEGEVEGGWILASISPSGFTGGLAGLVLESVNPLVCISGVDMAEPVRHSSSSPSVVQMVEPLVLLSTLQGASMGRPRQVLTSLCMLQLLLRTLPLLLLPLLSPPE